MGYCRLFLLKETTQFLLFIDSCEIKFLRLQMTINYMSGRMNNMFMERYGFSSSTVYSCFPFTFNPMQSYPCLQSILLVWSFYLGCYCCLVVSLITVWSCFFWIHLLYIDIIASIRKIDSTTNLEGISASWFVSVQLDINVWDFCWSCQVGF